MTRALHPRVLFWMFVALFSVESAPLRADSVTGDYSANHVSLQASSQSSFVGATLADTSGLISDSATAAPASFPHPPYRDDVSAATSISPTTGATKDIAQGTAGISFLSGTAATNDTFSFTLTGNASASAAKNSIGEDASAVVGMKGSIGFFIDSNFGPFPFPPGVDVGHVILDPLRAANPFEVFSSSVYQDSTLIGTLTPAGPGMTFDVVTGHSYEIALDYSMNVPFGSDPGINLQWGGTIASIPEPSSALLLCAGIALAGGIAWKRRRSNR